MLLYVNVNVNVFSLGLSNATEEQQVYSAIWDMPMLQGVCTSTGVWHSTPSGFLVVFEKPNRSSFTCTFTCTLSEVAAPSKVWAPASSFSSAVRTIVRTSRECRCVDRTALPAATDSRVSCDDDGAQDGHTEVRARVEWSETTHTATKHHEQWTPMQGSPGRSRRRRCTLRR